ncbi:hypothetical protein K458DRAFT_401146 [Lentithecium fluviatile CBS 122367]|uniref:Uncharacterized protein n=1 Tax=Lentithecium fluviatile CBS 122367 TaxID=1168545 RepID=A0A6G1JBS8_9PLEO|nr:hypothetical protein K458DRAFT_401146 [Lentithecium fluviatile CBS 122367]
MAYLRILMVALLGILLFLLPYSSNSKNVIDSDAIPLVRINHHHVGKRDNDYELFKTSSELYFTRSSHLVRSRCAIRPDQRRLDSPIDDITGPITTPIEDSKEKIEDDVKDKIDDTVDEFKDFGEELVHDLEEFGIDKMHDMLEKIEEATSFRFNMSDNISFDGNFDGGHGSKEGRIELIDAYANVDLEVGVGMAFSIVGAADALIDGDSMDGVDDTLKKSLTDLYVQVEAVEDLDIRLQGEVVGKMGASASCSVWIFPDPGAFACQAGPIIGNNLCQYPVNKGNLRKDKGNDENKGGSPAPNSGRKKGLGFRGALDRLGAWLKQEKPEQNKFEVKYQPTTISPSFSIRVGAKACSNVHHLQGNFTIGFGLAKSVSFGIGAKNQRKKNKGAGKRGKDKRADGGEKSDPDKKFLGSLGVLAFDLYAKLAIPELVFDLKTLGGTSKPILSKRHYHLITHNTR